MGERIAMRPGAEPDRRDDEPGWEGGTVWYWHTDHDTGRESDRFPGMYRAAIMWRYNDGSWGAGLHNGRSLPTGTDDPDMQPGRLYIEGRVEALLMADGYRVVDDTHPDRQRWGLPEPVPITDEDAAESGWREVQAGQEVPR